MELDELGGFLKSRRARMRPGDVGLAPGSRRRVPGLRRSEVAQLAGTSVEYYTELEQGRGTQPSTQILAALAQVLRLDEDEHSHLYHLAGRPVPVSADGAGQGVQPAMAELLEQLDSVPARVFSDLYVPLAQNRLSSVVLGEIPLGQGLAASFLYRWFTDPRTRATYLEEDHPGHSRMLVADLRAVVAQRGHDPEAKQMVAVLLQRSEEFAELWSTHDVAVRRQERKRLLHPELGLVTFECRNVFSEDGRQRLMLLKPVPGTETQKQLALLSSAA
ncbi:helix-turn-helix transcriptional regulator [Amycolatopsis pigmentata]|uniref:Helix-turn-helix transcriptional regulator n=1 Tax=Amycolatopsis pigmentata TaxID=450801 RepID=A0ABW5G386_9PSEU